MHKRNYLCESDASVRFCNLMNAIFIFLLWKPVIANNSSIMRAAFGGHGVGSDDRRHLLGVQGENVQSLFDAVQAIHSWLNSSTDQSASSRSNPRRTSLDNAPQVFF